MSPKSHGDRLASDPRLQASATKINVVGVSEPDYGAADRVKGSSRPPARGPRAQRPDCAKRSSFFLSMRASQVACTHACADRRRRPNVRRRSPTELRRRSGVPTGTPHLPPVGKLWASGRPCPGCQATRAAHLPPRSPGHVLVHSLSTGARAAAGRRRASQVFGHPLAALHCSAHPGVNGPAALRRFVGWMASLDDSRSSCGCLAPRRSQIAMRWGQGAPSKPRAGWAVQPDGRRPFRSPGSSCSPWQPVCPLPRPAQRRSGPARAGRSYEAAVIVGAATTACFIFRASASARRAARESPAKLARANPFGS